MKQQSRQIAAAAKDSDENLSLDNTSFDSVYRGFSDLILNVYSKRRHEHREATKKRFVGVAEKMIVQRAVAKVPAEEPPPQGLFAGQLKSARGLMQHLKLISNDLRRIHAPKPVSGVTASVYPRSRSTNCSRIQLPPQPQPPPPPQSQLQIKPSLIRRLILETPEPSPRNSMRLRLGEVTPARNLPAIRSTRSTTNLAAASLRMKERLMVPVLERNSDRGLVFGSLGFSVPKLKKTASSRHIFMRVRRRKSGGSETQSPKVRMEKINRIYGATPAGESTVSSGSGFRAAAERCVFATQYSPRVLDRSRSVLRLAFVNNH